MARMGNSSSRETIGIGIELELAKTPRNVHVSLWKKWDHKRAEFRKFESAMEKRSVTIRMDPINSNGRLYKYTEDYD